ncbi:MAG: MFS transporter [Rhodoglobus sp.]
MTTESTSPPAAPSLLRNRGFLWLWVGQTISQFGGQFSNLAIPVLAVTILNATELQMGYLNAAGTAAFLIVGLPAGAWVDRWLKRRTMIVADLVRAVALAAIPALFFAGVLQLWHVYIVAAVIGVATVFFDVSYQSYIPILVKPEQISTANSRLEATAQVAHIGGPGLAGALLSVLSAPVLLLADAVSFLVSAVSLWRIRDEEVPAPREERRPLRVEIAEGVRFVAHQPLIRRVVGTTAIFNLFGTMTFTLYPLFVLRDLHVSPAGLGITLSFGAAGGLLGAVLTPKLAKWFGEGAVIPLSAIASALLLALLPLAAVVPFPAVVPLLAVAEFGQSFMVLVYNITQVSLRQRICPPKLLGRMNASIRFVVWGVMPIASVAAGALGAALGVLPVMWIAVIGSLAGCAFVVFSPLWKLRTLPTQPDEQG